MNKSFVLVRYPNINNVSLFLSNARNCTYKEYKLEWVPGYNLERTNVPQIGDMIYQENTNASGIISDINVSGIDSVQLNWINVQFVANYFKVGDLQDNRIEWNSNIQIQGPSNVTISDEDEFGQFNIYLNNIEPIKNYE